MVTERDVKNVENNSGNNKTGKDFLDRLIGYKSPRLTERFNNNLY